MNEEKLHDKVLEEIEENEIEKLIEKLSNYSLSCNKVKKYINE
jgi:t-SNARE complex subunit (syntaxin)